MKEKSSVSFVSHLVNYYLHDNRSVKVDERHSWDELEDIHELVEEIKSINPGRYHVRRRGRGPRKMHESYNREYRCSIPLDKAAYVAVYIETR